MNIPVQVKLPVDLAVEINEKLKELITLHKAQRDRFLRGARAGGDTDKIMTEQERLATQERRLTVQHVIRVALDHGWPKTKSMPAGALMLRIMQDAIVVGRPRRGASVA